MALFSEFFRTLFAEAGVEIQYTVVNGQGGYFQNIKRILQFTDTRIVLAGKRDRLSVEGEGLSLGRYFGGDAEIRGDIRRVEKVDEGREEKK